MSDIRIKYKVLVEDNDDPVNKYLINNGLAQVGDTVDRFIWQSGDLTLARDVEKIIQQIRVGLFILVGDWVLDTTKGVDYIWGMREYPEVLSAQIKTAIAEVEGVEAVLKYNFIIDENYIFHVYATVKVGNSEIAINQDINAKDFIEV